jgi:hypothetical protein
MLDEIAPPPQLHRSSVPPTPAMSIKYKKSSIALLVIVVVGGIAVALETSEGRKLALPDDVVTLDEFSVKMPKPR